jgi:transcriptional regulator with XRE-family HTH domain
MRYIGRLERGKKSPPLTTVAAIADALPVEPVELLGGHGLEMKREAFTGPAL